MTKYYSRKQKKKKILIVIILIGFYIRNKKKLKEDINKNNLELHDHDFQGIFWFLQHYQFIYYIFFFK